LARLLADDNSPLLSFDFVDRRSGQQVRPDFATLEAIAFTAWWSNVRKRLTGAAYTIDDIIRDLMDTYVIAPKDRRAEERRSETPRRHKNADA